MRRILLAALAWASAATAQAPQTPVELRIDGPESFNARERFIAVLINRSTRPIVFVMPNRNPAYNVWARWTVRDAYGYPVSPRPDRIMICRGTTMYEETYNWPDGPDQPPILNRQIAVAEEDAVLLGPGQTAALDILSPDERFDLTARGRYSISLSYEFYPSLYSLTGESTKASVLAGTPSLLLTSNTLTVTRR